MKEIQIQQVKAAAQHLSLIHIFFVNEGFDEYQLREIRLGIEHCVDITKYLLHEYTGDQMKQLRLGLQAGLDVSWYSTVSYTHLV